MKIAHNVRLSVFCHEGEDCASIRKGLSVFIPFSLEDNRLSVSEKKAQGFEDRQIRIYDLFIQKDRLIRQFLESLKQKLGPETIALILRQLDSRVDDDCRFFLRFDKQRLLEDDMLWLTDRGDCYHTAVSIAAYPARKEKAVKVVRDFFS
ncbi:hypothetical protein GF351_03340 [Candidatus Woesearchaeota archaeon]|nr:hypothetical protein [Candidatus Woesearchaeota archaeon]